MGWSVDSELGFHVVWFPEVGFDSQNGMFISSNLSCFPNIEFSASHCT